MVERSARVEPYASEGPRLRDRVRGDQRRAGDHRAAAEDLHLAEPLPLADGQRDLDGHDHAFEQRPLDVDTRSAGFAATSRTGSFP